MSTRAAALLVLSIVLSFAPPAHAAGSLRLSWDRCAGSDPVAAKTFACDANTGYEVIYGSISFDDGQDRVAVGGIIAYLDVQVVSTTLPSWWLTRGGECRANALAISADPANLPTGGSCVAWTTAPVLSVFNISEYDDGMNDITLSCVAAPPEGTEITLPHGQELGVLRIGILRSASSGAGACAGCTTPACIGFGNMRLSFALASGLPDEDLVGSTSSAVSWQGGYVASYAPVPVHQDGSGIVTYHGHLSCTAQPVGTQNRPWGTTTALSGSARGAPAPPPATRPPPARATASRVPPARGQAPLELSPSRTVPASRSAW